MTHLTQRRSISIALSALMISAGSAFADQDTSSILISPPSFSGEGWDMKLSGRIQFDYNRAEADTATGFDLDDTEWRRVRLGASGKLGSTVRYKAELNTNSSGDVNVTDLLIQYAPKGSVFKFKVGQFKTPNSLEEQASSRFISTQERAGFTDAFEFNRRIGIGVSTEGEDYTLSAGLFAGNLKDDAADQGFVAAGRATYTPINTGNQLIHLGASLRYREQGREEGLIRYRQRPYAHISGRIISTGRVAVRDTFIGLEALAILGPVWTSAEYGKSFANTTSPGSNPEVEGGYIEAGTFFGGNRGYKGGKFDRPVIDKPIGSGGYGAMAVVVRYDMLDLNDAGADGGQLNTFIAGVDWWPTGHTRIGVNLFKSDASLGNSTSGLGSNFATLVAAGVPDENVQGLTARLQFDF
ncbi:MAG: OprO/OprP family phosphate-selective porin [Henriciella sp.]|nr:OprO/OprP family phosphate-selective porin [Henriciella sp.]